MCVCVRACMRACVCVRLCECEWIIISGIHPILHAGISIESTAAYTGGTEALEQDLLTCSTNFSPA